MTFARSVAEGDETSRHWSVVLWTSAIFAAVLLPLTASLAGFQDGDGLLTALISTQKLTWYFWGQDRLLNFIPALAYPIHDIEWNLRAQIFLRALFAFLAPAGILCFLTDDRRTIALGTLLTNAILMLALSQYAAFNLYVQHNPFASSMVLLWAAWRLAQWRGVARWLAIVPILFIAYATNLALFAVALPMLGLIFVLGSRPRALIFGFGVANVIAVYLAVRHGAVFGDAHDTRFGLAPSFEAIRNGYAYVAREIAWPWVLATCVAMLALGTWKRAPRTLTALGLAGGMLLLIGALSCAAWAQSNLYNIRYYLAFVLAFVAVATYMLLSVENRLRIPSFAAPAVAALLLMTGFFVGLGGVSATPRALVTPQWRDEAPAIARVALDERTPLIVGSFWDVWSAVFVADTTPGKPLMVYGGTLRGDVLRDRIVAAAAADGSVRTLCFLESVTACANMAAGGLKTPMVPAGEDPGKVMTVAGKTIRIVTLRFVDPTTAAMPAIGPWGHPASRHLPGAATTAH